MDSHRQYLDLYRDHAATLCEHSCGAMNALRGEAARLLDEGGLPGTREERYKYTDAQAAFAPDYGVNLKRLMDGRDPYSAYRCNVPNLSTALFFVVNDVPYAAAPASLTQLPEGVVVDSLCRVAESRPEILQEYYGRAAATDRGFRSGRDGVTLLNTLLAQDGLVVYVPDGVRVEQPVQIVNVNAGRADLLNSRRVLVIAGRGAELSLLLCDHSEEGAKYLTTQVAEVYAAEGARVSVFSVEETNEATTRFSTVYVEQEAGSRFNYDGVTLTCGRTRNRLDVRLRGEGAETALYGAVVADGEQRVDNNVLVEHLAPGCASDMLYKYVLDDHSVGAFAGKVYVEKGAQRTASQQTNANICAAPTARAYSQPMLEIYADDVRCNHGSSTGRLDETALLYMRQRGIPEAEARLMLQHAFVNEVLAHVAIPRLRERLSHLVDLRFRGELGHCKGCRACK